MSGPINRIGAALACALAVLGCGSTTHPRRATIPPAARTVTSPDLERAPQRLVVRASQLRWKLGAPVYRTVAATSGRSIYVLGGHDAAGATIDTVSRADVATGAVTSAGRLAVLTHGAAAATFDGRLLVFGGASTTVHDLVQRFDPRTHSASVIGHLPGPRADVTAAVVGHAVLLIGGFDGIGPQREVWASADGRRFHAIAKLPQAVRYAAVVADRDCAYVFGGLISGGEYDGRFSSLVQRVCVSGHPSAAVIARLPMPLAHAMGALVAGRVLVIGGSTPHGPSDLILRFDPSRRHVVRVGRLPHPLTDAAVATVGERAYLLGGISTRPLASVIEVRLVAARADPPAPRPCALRPVLAGRTRVVTGAVALAAGFGSLWVSGFGSVTRVDPVTGRVIARIRTPGTGDHTQLATGVGSLWVTAAGNGVVYRIDPRRDRINATVRLGEPVLGIAYGAGRVWVTQLRHGVGRLIAIDPRTDRATGQPIQVGPGPGQVLYARHALWVQNTSPASVVRVDPRTRRVKTLIDTTPLAPGATGPGAIGVSHDSLWSTANGSLTRVDPSSGQTRSRVPLPRGVAIVFAHGRGWVLSYPRSSSTTVFDPIPGTAVLWQIDPNTGRVLGGPLRLHAAQPIALTVARQSLWIADYAKGALTRFRLLPCRTHRPEPSLPRRFVDRRLGITMSYPPGWQIHQRPLTRVISPRQLLALTSFAIRQQRPDPNCTPKTAVSQLPPHGVLLILLEQTPPQTRSGGHGFFGQRPEHFRLEDLAARQYECFGLARELAFQTAGRDLYLLAYLGPTVARRTEQLADRALDSLRLTRPSG
jgi:streptogramin lyase